MIDRPPRFLHTASAVFAQLQQFIGERIRLLDPRQPLAQRRRDGFSQAFARQPGDLNRQRMRFGIFDVQRNFYLSTSRFLP